MEFGIDQDGQAVETGRTSRAPIGMMAQSTVIWKYGRCLVQSPPSEHSGGGTRSKKGKVKNLPNHVTRAVTEIRKKQKVKIAYEMGKWKGEQTQTGKDGQMYQINDDQNLFQVGAKAIEHTIEGRDDPLEGKRGRGTTKK